MDRVGTVFVVPALEGWPLRELQSELHAALPTARIVSPEQPCPTAPHLVVLAFRHRLHRHLLHEKLRLLVRGLRTGAPALLLFDVTRRRAEVIPRNRIGRWYLARLLEYAALRAARSLGWRPS
ncbi:MAG TPA: hypothetical protein VKW76_11665 [Candidatus Binatia bacterium]|nr:hypothetical protein [Candidatus Binatia bacterium]